MTIAWGRVELHALSCEDDGETLIVAGSQFEMYAEPHPISGVINKSLDSQYTFEEYAELEKRLEMQAVMPYADEDEITLTALDLTEREEIVPHQSVGLISVDFD